MTSEAGQLAGRWKRLAGALLDVLVSVIVTVPIVMTAGVFTQIPSSQEMTLSQRVLLVLLGSALFLLINGYLLAKHGQTVGKKLVGTRVVRNGDHGIPTLGCLFGLRHLPFSIIGQIPVVGNLFVLADCLFIFRQDKRCLHDLIAGTKVVNA